MCTFTRAQHRNEQFLFGSSQSNAHNKRHQHVAFQISGTIANTGHSVIFTADNDTSSVYEGPQTPVNLTGGPLSYRYRFQEIHIHYGLHDQFGSEHSVQGYTFPAEVNCLNKT